MAHKVQSKHITEKRKESQEFTHPYRNATWFFILLVLRIILLPKTIFTISNQCVITQQCVTTQHINEHKYKQEKLK